jgi:hypothetical protein
VEFLIMDEKKKDIVTEIRNWLDDQGYPLEMRVARTFQEHDFRVVQSDYYTDPESEESREIDVVAWFDKVINGVVTRIVLVIECKVSKDKPWLLFSSGKQVLSDRGRLKIPAVSKVAKKLLLELRARDDIVALPLFKTPPTVYGLTQAFQKGKDVCYQAAMTATKAAIAKNIEVDREQRSKLYSVPICQITFPVVVVDGRLFQIQLSDKSAIEISEIDWGVLVWRKAPLDKPFVGIHVLSLNSLERFCQETAASISFLFDVFEETITDALREFLHMSR